MRKSDNLIVAKILAHIPVNEKPARYLIKLLHLSSESVYRRLRGEIPFSLDEIIKLSYELNFSIDEAIGTKKEERVFFDLQQVTSPYPKGAFLEMLQHYYNHLSELNTAKVIESIMAINRTNVLLTLEYELLFKFYYYKWLHQINNLPSNAQFCEVVVPQEILILVKKCIDISPKISSKTIIMDRDIHLSFIREIQYYYKRRLISKEDLELLKEEILNFTYSAEKIAQNGINKYGEKVYVYLSTLDIESNSSIFTYDENMVSHHWVYSINPMITNNREACILHKQWLESLKKYSVLISNSNEIAWANYFSEQKYRVANMSNEIH